eukprot:COSAG01_NODE_43706_length_427_cov_0.719512_1_plen_97_part_01
MFDVKTVAEDPKSGLCHEASVSRAYSEVTLAVGRAAPRVSPALIWLWLAAAQFAVLRNRVLAECQGAAWIPFPREQSLWVSKLCSSSHPPPAPFICP